LWTKISQHISITNITLLMPCKKVIPFYSASDETPALWAKFRFTDRPNR
jgi:hypothetical protein